MAGIDLVTIAEFFNSSGLVHSGYVVCTIVCSRSVAVAPFPRIYTLLAVRAFYLNVRLASGALATYAVRACRYTFVNSDEGWEEQQRNASSGKIVPSAAFGGNDAGIKAMVNKIHGLGLKVGLYGAASGVTCGNAPGQLYHEDIDAQTYADWGVDYLKVTPVHTAATLAAATQCKSAKATGGVNCATC